MNILIILMTNLFIFNSAFAEGHKLIRTIDFIGYSQSTDKKIFYGVETLKESAKTLIKETKYFSLDDKMLYTDYLLFQKDGFGMLEFKINDAGTGYKLAAEYSNKELKYSVRTSEKSSKEETYTKDAKKPMITPKALQEVVTKNWDKLLKKEVEFDLFIPEKETTVGFALELTLKDKAAKVKLNAQSWFFRLFLPNISFEFADDAQKSVTKYLGPSLFEINGEDPGNIRIEFKQSNAKKS